VSVQYRQHQFLPVYVDFHTVMSCTVTLSNHRANFPDPVPLAKVALIDTK
jgi:hypothetical protein